MGTKRWWYDRRFVFLVLALCAVASFSRGWGAMAMISGWLSMIAGLSVLFDTRAQCQKCRSYSTETLASLMSPVRFLEVGAWIIPTAQANWITRCFQCGHEFVRPGHWSGKPE